MKSFASDNYAGVLPEVLAALERCNLGHAKAYGADDLTAAATQRFREAFGHPVDVYFVFNGTGANILSLAGCVESHQSVLCAKTSHLYVDESTAPETFLGSRLVPLDTTADGKISEASLLENIKRRGDVHFAQPQVLSITQSTEFGTLYQVAELKRLSAICRAQGLLFHIDGARFFQAAAALRCSLAELSTEVGVDVLSLGGTKVGMMYGEAVLLFNHALKARMDYKHKQITQLPSKTRFIAAQFLAVLENELWRRSAAHSNQMAQKLAARLARFPQLVFTQKVEANALFLQMPSNLYQRLAETFPFYVWNEKTQEVRIMCSFDTTDEDLESFVRLIR